MTNLYSPDPKGALNPEDYNYFLTKRRQINDTFGLGTGQVKYERGSARLGYNQRRQQLVQKFAQLGEQVPGRYARRGLLNSGIYQHGLADFINQRDTALSQLDQRFQQQLQGFDLGESQLEAVRRSALDDIESQEAARRAAVAAMVRPHL